MAELHRPLDFGRDDYRRSIVLLRPVEDEDDLVDFDEDEPLFLLRPKDILAADIVREWANRLEQMGGDRDTVKHARDRAALMDEWRRAGGGGIPDLER